MTYDWLQDVPDKELVVALAKARSLAWEAVLDAMRGVPWAVTWNAAWKIVADAVCAAAGRSLDGAEESD